MFNECGKHEGNGGNINKMKSGLRLAIFWGKVNYE
jgi:hypothetical protein